MPITKKRDRKLLAYYTQPREVSGLAEKHNLHIDDLRQIIFSVNNNGKPARSIAKIEKAIEAYKEKQQNAGS